MPLVASNPPDSIASVPTVDMAEPGGNSQGSAPQDGGTALTPDAPLPSERLAWIQCHWKLDAAKLPGRIKCTLARDALERHKQIRKVKDEVLNWNDVFPPSEWFGLSKAIR